MAATLAICDSFCTDGYPPQLLLGVITPLPKAGQNSCMASNTRLTTIIKAWYQIDAELLACLQSCQCNILN